MNLDEVPRVSRRKGSHKKRRSRRARRTAKVIGWSLLGLVALGIFVTGAIYIVLSMRGEGTGMPTTTPVRTGLPPG